jgi:hypothetical protein
MGSTTSKVVGTNEATSTRALNRKTITFQWKRNKEVIDQLLNEK